LISLAPSHLHRWAQSAMLMSDSLWALKEILRATVSRLVPVVVPRVVGTGPAKSDHQQLDPHQANPLAWLSLAEVEESAVPSLDVAVHEEGLPNHQCQGEGKHVKKVTLIE